MGLLDFVKNRDRPANEKPAAELSSYARQYGHSSFADLAAEIRHDEGMAKVRDETGKEPPASTPKTVPRTKPSWER